MSDNHIAVAVYDAHTGAEQAVKKLQGSGFDMKKLSITGKNPHAEEHVAEFYNAGDRMKHWGKAGAFWGGLWGLVFGAEFFSIPGMGPVRVAGPLVAWMIGALESAVVVGGVSAVGAGFFSVGLPRDSILKYGTASEAGRARDILQGSHPAEPHLHRLKHAGEREPALAAAIR